MPAHEFSFALEISSESPMQELLQDLTARVLAFVGCQSEQATAAVQALQAAVQQAKGAGGPSRLEFTATGGSLTITLTAGDDPVWHITQPTT